MFLDVEGGTTTIRKRRDIDVIQIRSMKKIEEVFDELAKDTSGYYKTVVIDSLTELQKLDMRTVMKQAENQRGSDKVDIYVPSMREWGKSGERMRIIVRGFKDLPINTIATCMLAEKQDETTGITSFYPSLPGKLRSEIPGFFDIVGMLSSKTVGSGDAARVVRTLQVTRTRRVVAKDRTSALGDIVDNPSIPLMWDLITDDGQVHDEKGGKLSE